MSKLNTSALELARDLYGVLVIQKHPPHLPLSGAVLDPSHSTLSPPPHIRNPKLNFIRDFTHQFRLQAATNHPCLYVSFYRRIPRLRCLLHFRGPGQDCNHLKFPSMLLGCPPVSLINYRFSDAFCASTWYTMVRSLMVCSILMLDAGNYEWCFVAQRAKK